EHVKYVAGVFDDPAAYATLSRILDELEREAGAPLNRAFYLSTSPTFFPVIVESLGQSKLARREGAEVPVIIGLPFATTPALSGPTRRGDAAHTACPQ